MNRPQPAERDSALRGDSSFEASKDTRPRAEGLQRRKRKGKPGRSAVEVRARHVLPIRAEGSTSADGSLLPEKGFRPDDMAEVSSGQAAVIDRELSVRKDRLRTGAGSDKNPGRRRPW